MTEYWDLEFYTNKDWSDNETWPKPTNDKGFSQSGPAAIRRNRMLPMNNRTRGDVGLN